FRRGLALPPVEQTIIAKRLVTLSPAPHLPITNADDLGRLPPRNLLRHGPQNHFLDFHRPLHRGLRVGNHAPHGLLLSPHAKRTDHLLIRPDISCANDNFEVPTLAKNARVGQPQLWWPQEHSNAGWASPPRSSEYVSGWWPLAAFLQRCGFCIANTSPVKHHHRLPTHFTAAHHHSPFNNRHL